MPVARKQALVKNGHPTRLWRIRNKQRLLDKGPTRRLADFEHARGQLTIRLFKIDSIADRLPLIVMSIQTEKQLRELIWYIAVVTRRALARCSHEHRCQLGLFGTSRGLPDWRDCVYRGGILQRLPNVNCQRSASASCRFESRELSTGARFTVR